MDNSAPDITFDADGVCNFCHQAQGELDILAHAGMDIEKRIYALRDPKNKYDVLIGLSGGVDSSYALHKAVQYGLRPLCFSIDTGYNKPAADENIMRLVEGMKVPFYRYTIDLAKFRDLQAAFMRAGVKNIEIPTDHVLMAASYEMAAKYGIKTILSGGNVASESIMPPSWGYNARDLTHIKDIYRKSLKGLPTCGIWKWNWYRWVKKIKVFYLLDYLFYSRKDAEKFLEEKYGFVSTGEKHEENYFTWWFQNYYLFEKFGIDKRKAHMSSLVNSGQLTRDEAMVIISQNPVYPTLGIEKKVMAYPRREHTYYKMDKWYGRIASFIKLWK